MENNLQVISKRVWSIVRVTFFMLRKGISKGKLMMNLNMILKRRRKLAGKAIASLMSHHHNHGGSTSNRHSHDSHSQFTSSREYEFSCSDTPNHFFSIGKRHHNHNHRHNHNHNDIFTRASVPSTRDEEVATMNAIVLEMLNNDQTVVEASHAQSGMVGHDDEKDNEVDKAAEDFIKRFYSQLRKQD